MRFPHGFIALVIKSRENEVSGSCFSRVFFACFLASFITTKDNYFMILSKLILSVSTIYILGVVWLGILIGWDKPLVQLGVTPFLLAEFTKIALLTVLAKKLLKLRKFI